MVKENKYRILLIRYTPMGGRGDMLLATPTFKALKEKYPKSHITLFTAPHLAVIVKGNPYIDEIVLKPPSKTKYNRVILLDYIKLPSNLHIIDAFAINANVTLLSKKPYIYIGEEHWREARRFREYYNISDEDLTIAVHRGPTWPERMWPEGNYIKVANYFKDKYKAKFIEVSQFPNMGLGLGIDLTGKTSIRQTAAVLKGCKLLLCVDSFVLHLASTVDTPTVAVFGCTNPAQRMPFNDICMAVDTPSQCKHCYHYNQKRLSNLCIRDRIYCMESITPDMVIDTMEKLLKKMQSIYP